MRALVLAEHDNGSLNEATARTVTAAAALGGDVDILVAGADCGAAASAAAGIAGVARVLVSDDAGFSHMLAENCARLAAGLMGEYDAFLAAATTNGKNIAPRLAAHIDVAQISEITAVLSADSFERPIYAGNAIETVQSPQAKNVITVRTTAFAAAAEGGSAEIVTVDAVADSGLSRFSGEELSRSERPELSSAKIVISGGRGMGSAENFAMLDRIADRLGAAVGASRAAVDAGYVPNEYQVGQTGKMVAPELYIAVGISGAIQHLAGMKDSRVIVAINKDEEAPIFQVSDYGLVADLFQALPELEAELDKLG
ncbi:MAG: electron transfer flavoprotein subunit alpha [Hyphomicrobiales bacterium]|nr:MAG: electron transfer flavoprotein subunit alpha [Hyphomicrobiales bacterium]